MIKNVVFDVGNVLIDFQPLEYIMSLGFDRETANVLANKTFKSDLWIEHDRGTYSCYEIWENLNLANPEHSVDFDKIRDHWLTNKVPVIQGSIDFLLECNKQGYSTYILSNYNAGRFAHVEEQHPALSQVKGKILSGNEGVIKPEPEIYKILLERFDLVPGETIFIDDKRENVEAAQALGIHGIVFTHPKQLRKEFQEIIAVR